MKKLSEFIQNVDAFYISGCRCDLANMESGRRMKKDAIMYIIRYMAHKAGMPVQEYLDSIPEYKPCRENTPIDVYWKWLDANPISVDWEMRYGEWIPVIFSMIDHWKISWTMPDIDLHPGDRVIAAFPWHECDEWKRGVIKEKDKCGDFIITIDGTEEEKRFSKSDLLPDFPD